jgi:hypothetical protein
MSLGVRFAAYASYGHARRCQNRTQHLIRLLIAPYCSEGRLIERRFAELTICKLRRSAHRSVTELEADMRKLIN